MQGLFTLRSKLAPLRGYGLAFVLVSAALVLTLLLEAVFSTPFWFLFLGAVMASAWFGGKGPGWLAATLSALAADRYLIPPRSGAFGLEELGFFAVALGAAWVSSNRRQWESALKQARDELEDRVEERTRELQKANAALRENERELRLQTEVIAQQIWSALPDGSIEYCNQRLLTYHGCSLRDMQGFGFLKYIHAEDRERVRGAWREAVAQGTVYDIEARQLRSDGQHCWFLIRSLPLRDDAGNILKWYGTNTDIDDRKHAEQALLRTQTELAHLSRVLTMGELTTLIAHEVNQPLAAVVTNADAALRWLAAQPPNLEKARESMSWIVKEGNRAGEIIKRVRSLSKRAVPQNAVLDINDVIREVVELLSAEMARNHVLLQARLEAGLPGVMGDRVQLQQVLLNLTMNAIEAMSGVLDRSRELFIASECRDAVQVLVTVSDTGTGVDPQQLDQIFDAFVTTKAHGIGMGLSISRRIVESHGGRLWAAPNGARGAIFQFTLPIAAESGS